MIRNDAASIHGTTSKYGSTLLHKVCGPSQPGETQDEYNIIIEDNANIRRTLYMDHHVEKPMQYVLRVLVMQRRQ